MNPCGALPLCVGALALLSGAGADPQAEAELEALARRVPAFRAIALPRAAGRVELSPDQSLTIDALRGVALDDDPPAPGKPAKPYDPRMSDAFPPGKAPYVAEGIRPFRFRFFHNEFNYGGWHTWKMADYAVAHGFDILHPYASSPAERTGVPKGTRWLRWGGFVDWHQRVPDQRYDKLADQDVARQLIGEGLFKANPGYDYLMIDLEHPRPSLAALRKMPWYPAGAPEAERRAFETRYYDGYAKTYIAPVQAARAAGWRRISLYGWQPFARAYWGLEKATADPATDWAWNAYGKQIYRAVDLLNPSVYCFYWTPKNVAYTLANIDLNLRLVRSTGEPKPVRPYYWTLLHGGGGGWRWWQGQPLPSEDARAMATLAFFTGIDGIVLWNWSGTGDHTVPQLRSWDRQTKQWQTNDVMVGRSFELRPEGLRERVAPVRFERYDALHILSVGDDEVVRFQRIERDNPRGNYGCTPERPVYVMRRAELLRHLRPQAEPVAALIEGLALAKAFEYILRHGDVRIDVPAQRQFAEALPIVRRVRLGAIHVLATYDPMRIHGGGPRRIVLEDFEGVAGRTVVLAADAQTRLFVLREPRPARRPEEASRSTRRAP